MYLRLSPDKMIPIRDIVAILPYPKQRGRAVLRSFDLPVRSVGTAEERDWRSLVITEDAVYSLPQTGETMLRRYQKCLKLLAHREKA